MASSHRATCSRRMIWSAELDGQPKAEPGRVSASSVWRLRVRDVVDLTSNDVPSQESLEHTAFQAHGLSVWGG